MKLLTATLLLASSAFGQSINLSLSGPTSAKQGSTINLILNMSGSQATGPAALQWTLTPPAGFTTNLPSAGLAATAASKTLACDSAKLLCLLYGINQNIVGNGAIATLPITVPSSITGQVTFSLGGLVAASKDGVSMPITGAPFSVSVLSKSDLNGDGVVNSADVTLMVAQATGGTCTDDQNGDGKCDVLDVMGVVLRALGF